MESTPPKNMFKSAFWVESIWTMGGTEKYCQQAIYEQNKSLQQGIDGLASSTLQQAT